MRLNKSFPPNTKCSLLISALIGVLDFTSGLTRLAQTSTKGQEIVFLLFNLPLQGNQVNCLCQGIHHMNDIYNKAVQGIRISHLKTSSASIFR